VTSVNLPSGARAPDLDHLRWLDAASVGGWRGKAVLDLGCGSGFLCQLAHEGGARHVVGADLLPPDRAPRGWQHCVIDLDAERWDAELPRPDGGASGFDLVLAFDILEHLSAPVRFLSACARLLAPSGCLVLTTPNTNSWERILRPSAWSGATDPQHRILFNRYSLRFLVERCGFLPVTLAAPVRKLGGLAPLAPQVGAQIFCVAKKSP
jgi:2-polyprenyl-3-methyl-5-hydroxy-6-metoxy-1,4-benzoquinol methylase